uniref:Immunoglobulin V-set domain-containing protein n=1 Tax=Oncorhynchus kisutch TaxID=8019 RepID=A0A8C7HH63_ONCKI
MLLLFTGTSVEDVISGHVTALEGGLVTLSCNYTTSSSTSPDLFWYIQLTRNSPQYVLRRDRYSEGSNSDEFQGGFDSRLNFTSSSVECLPQDSQCLTMPTTRRREGFHGLADMGLWLSNLLILAACCYGIIILFF